METQELAVRDSLEEERDIVPSTRKSKKRPSADSALPESTRNPKKPRQDLDEVSVEEEENAVPNRSTRVLLRLLFFIILMQQSSRARSPLSDASSSPNVM